MPVDPERAPLRVQSLGKALDILLAIANSQSGPKASQIIKTTGLSKQATHHLLHSLATLGLVQRNEHGGYVLGLTVGQLAEAFQRQFDPPEQLVRIVRSVANETGETSHISGWWNGEIVTLTTARGARVLQVSNISPGTHADAHARASGKLLLAMAGSDRYADFLAAHPLSQRTANTIVSRADLDSALTEIRSQFYATDREEFAPDLCCLAIPVRSGPSTFALAVSWPTSRFETDWRRYLDVLRRHAG